MLEWLDNVDVIASGHVHQEMVVNVAPESINSLGRIKRKEGYLRFVFRPIKMSGATKPVASP